MAGTGTGPQPGVLLNLAPAQGRHSNVTVNLTAREAVSLREFLLSPEKWTCDPDAMTAIDKCVAAGERAAVPWSER